MVRQDVDWKNDGRTALDWVAVALAVLLVGLYVATWLRVGEEEPLALAALLCGWVGIYVTRFWQPVLYLLAAVVFGGSVAVDFLSGIPDGPFHWLVAATTVAFVVVVLSLFLQEETYR